MRSTSSKNTGLFSEKKYQEFLKVPLRLLGVAPVGTEISASLKMPSSGVCLMHRVDMIQETDIISSRLTASGVLHNGIPQWDWSRTLRPFQRQAEKRSYLNPWTHRVEQNRNCPAAQDQQEDTFNKMHQYGFDEKPMRLSETIC